MSSRSRYPRTPRREDGKPSGWDRYLNRLVQNRVPEAARQWYVTCARQFIDWMRPDRLSDLTLDDITGYFQEVSGDSRLNAWQFRQMVEVVQPRLAVDRGVVANTQSLAFNAVAFLYRGVLQRRPDDIQFARVRRPRRLPVVLAPDEVSALLDRMAGVYKVMATLCTSSFLCDQST